MALTLSLSLVDAVAIANRPTKFQLNITNTSTSSVTLNSIAVSEATESDCIITQPNFMTPNVAIGVGNPTIGASSTVSYVFLATFQSPATPGASPAYAPGSAGQFAGQPADASFSLLAIASASDGSVGSTLLPVSVLTAIAPFPPVSTGTLQLQFSSGFNLIALPAIGA
jgi:hypothetical protein